MMHCAGAVHTHRGRVRERNEDACWFGRCVAERDLEQALVFDFAAEPSWCVVLADGMGGHLGGQRASREVVQAFSTLEAPTPATVDQRLREVDVLLRLLGRNVPALRGLGAAVAGLAFGPSGLFAFNAGDARVYRERRGYLQQITRDDSVAQRLIDQRMLDPSAPRPPEMHQLTQAVGAGATFAPHLYPVEVRTAARFLICSDGLTDLVALGEMEALILEPGSPAEAVDRLVSAALDAGGRDNVTVALVDVSTEAVASATCGQSPKT